MSVNVSVHGVRHVSVTDLRGFGSVHAKLSFHTESNSADVYLDPAIAFAMKRTFDEASAAMQGGDDADR